MSIEAILTRLCEAVEANTAALGAEAPKAKGRAAKAADSSAASTGAAATAGVQQAVTQSAAATSTGTATTAASAATAQTAAAVASPSNDPRANPGYKETAEKLTKAAEKVGRDPVVAVLAQLQTGCQSLLQLNPAHYAAARAAYDKMLAPAAEVVAAANSGLV